MWLIHNVGMASFCFCFFILDNYISLFGVFFVFQKKCQRFALVHILNGASVYLFDQIIAALSDSLPISSPQNKFCSAAPKI